MATIMQIAITRFGFNPSGWQTIIQQACLKTVEEESQKDRISWFEKLGGRKEHWTKKQLISVASKKRRIRTAGYQHLAWQAWQGNAESGFRTHLATTFDAIML